MAKASLTLKDGTKVLVEGSTEEIQKIISLYHPSTELSAEGKKGKKSTSRSVKQTTKSESKPNLSELVNAVKSCDEAEHIEENILDRSSQVDRILLPLYIAHKYFSNNIALTSGEIMKILSDLGIRVFQTNVAKTFRSTGSKYVIGDKIRKKGQAVRYRLSRRGVQYLSTVIRGKTDD